MNFWKDHFDHLLLVVIGASGAWGGIWCTSHHYDDASKWLFAQAAAGLAALLMRMNGPRTSSPNVPPQS